MQAIYLSADAESKHTYTATVPLTKTGRYKLQLVDAVGRGNKQPPEFVFTVLPNRRPEIKLVFPSRDVQVSPLEEIELQASVWDDFGLDAYGIAYQPGRSAAARDRARRAHGRQTAIATRGSWFRSSSLRSSPTSCSPITSSPTIRAPTASFAARRAICSSAKSGPSMRFSARENRRRATRRSKRGPTPTSCSTCKSESSPPRGN